MSFRCPAASIRPPSEKSVGSLPLFLWMGCPIFWHEWFSLVFVCLFTLKRNMQKMVEILNYVVFLWRWCNFLPSDRLGEGYLDQNNSKDGFQFCGMADLFLLSLVLGCSLSSEVKFWGVSHCCWWTLNSLCVCPQHCMTAEIYSWPFSLLASYQLGFWALHPTR